MARPRIIKLDNGGEIIIKNVPMEEADRIKSVVLAVKEEMTPVTTKSEDGTEEVTKFVPKILPEVALGISRTGNQWAVFEVRYDPNTKEARVDKEHPSGHNESRYVTAEQFKLLAERLGIV